MSIVVTAAGGQLGRLVYTSAPKATTSALVLAPEHKATEEIIAASGLPSTILCNSDFASRRPCYPMDTVRGSFVPNRRAR